MNLTFSLMVIVLIVGSLWTEIGKKHVSFVCGSLDRPPINERKKKLMIMEIEPLSLAIRPVSVNWLD